MSSDQTVSPALLPAQVVVRPDEHELDALSALLNSADRVTLLCGRGCYGAYSRVLRLAETLKPPIVHALGGKEAIEHDNPYDVGRPG